MRVLLADLIDWQPCATVFVTHDVKEGIQLADRIIALNGRPCQIVNTFCPEKGLRQQESYQKRLAEVIMSEAFGESPSVSAGVRENVGQGAELQQII